MIEIWKDIKNYEGLYQVSSKGRVRSLRSSWGKLREKPKILKPDVNFGYECVVLYGEDRKRFRVNRLVALHFKGDPPKGKTLALHKDGDRRNNCEENIYWGDYSDNNKDTVRHGNNPDNRGAKSGKAKLSFSDVAVIKMALFKGNTQTYLATKFGVDQSTISHISSGKSWSAKNYVGGLS